MRVARRVREAARRNGSIERRDRASGRLHRPEEHCRDGVPPVPPQNQAGPGRAWLAHPALTGMPHDQWDRLIAGLEAARALQREDDLQRRRGGDRQKIPGAGLYTGRRPGLTLADRLLATLLYQRHRLPQVAIAPLFAVVPQTLNRAISQTRRLLDEVGHTIEPTATRLATLDELIDLAAELGVTPTPQINPGYSVKLGDLTPR